MITETSAPVKPTIKKQSVKKTGSKKKVSGFMLFSKEHRQKVKDENPEISFGQMGKKLGEMWRALSDEEKKEYKERKG